MTRSFTISQLDKLKADGMIRGYSLPAKPKQTPGGKKAGKHYRKGDKAKDWIGWALWEWCQDRSLVHEEEYRFHPVRKWRFDWAVPSKKLAIEYNGIFSEKSRHTTPTGYTGDLNKMNAAQALGWRVIQLSPLNYKDLITELNKNV